MESGSITDAQITASTHSSLRPPKDGRLNFDSDDSWCAQASDNTPHLQIDLGSLHIICAVATQGNSKSDQWVKTYKLQSSTDGSSWSDYQEDSQVKVSSHQIKDKRFRFL